MYYWLYWCIGRWNAAVARMMTLKPLALYSGKAYDVKHCHRSTEGQLRTVRQVNSPPKIQQISHGGSLKRTFPTSFHPLQFPAQSGWFNCWWNSDHLAVKFHRFAIATPPIDRCECLRWFCRKVTINLCNCVGRSHWKHHVRRLLFQILLNCRRKFGSDRKNFFAQIPSMGVMWCAHQESNVRLKFRLTTVGKSD